MAEDTATPYFSYIKRSFETMKTGSITATPQKE
jgi:hypothetical protein